MPKPRLPLRRLALCIVLGAVTSWVVAAGFAVWGSKHPKRHFATYAIVEAGAEGKLVVLRIRHLNIGFESRVAVAVANALTPDEELLPPLAEYAASSAQNLPRPGKWGRSQTTTDQQLCMGPYRVREEGFGWPRLSFWYPVVLDGFTGAFSGRGGFDLSKPPPNTRTQLRAIPFLPIWPGLLANTAFYAALWSLPLFTLPVLKQRRHKRRGHCARCNYDLKDAFEQGCPECGWKRPSIPDP